MIKTDLSTSVMFCIFFVAVKEVNVQNFKECGQLSRKILIFKESQVPLKWYFKFKHFSRSSRICMSHDQLGLVHVLEEPNINTARIYPESTIISIFLILS